MTEQALTRKEVSYQEYLERFAGEGYEYVGGRLVAMGVEMMNEWGEMIVPQPKLIHGLIVGRIMTILARLLDDKFGLLLAEMGFIMRQDPIEHRAVDVAFVLRGNLEKVEDITQYLPFPPDFAVEVISENDRADKIQEKIQSYMNNGTKLLWVVYPITRQVVVYRPGKSPQIAGIADKLEGGDLLPGLAIAVAEIFDVLPN